MGPPGTGEEFNWIIVPRCRGLPPQQHVHLWACSLSILILLLRNLHPTPNLPKSLTSFRNPGWPKLALTRAATRLNYLHVPHHSTPKPQEELAGLLLKAECLVPAPTSSYLRGRGREPDHCFNQSKVHYLGSWVGTSAKRLGEATKGPSGELAFPISVLRRQKNHKASHRCINYLLTEGLEIYFFLDTPTVRPRRPVVLVCWPRTRRLQVRKEKGHGHTHYTEKIWEKKTEHEKSLGA